MGMLPTLLIAAAGFTVGDSPWGEPVKGLATRVSLVTENPTLGKPVFLKVEAKNVGQEAMRYEYFAAQAHNAFKITGPDGTVVPFVYQDRTAGMITVQKTIQPNGENVVEDKFELSKYYLIDKPGVYTISYLSRGKLPMSKPLNLNVANGTVPEQMRMYNSLRKVLPSEWSVCFGKSDGVFTSYWLVYSKTGKKSDGNNVNIGIEFVKTDDPQMSREGRGYTLFGKTSLGNAKATAPSRVGGAKDVWPEYVEVIQKVLKEFP